MRDYVPFALTAVKWLRSTFTICTHKPEYSKPVEALPRVQYEKITVGLGLEPNLALRFALCYIIVSLPCPHAIIPYCTRGSGLTQIIYYTAIIMMHIRTRYRMYYTYALACTYSCCSAQLQLWFCKHVILPGCKIFIFTVIALGSPILASLLVYACLIW